MIANTILTSYKYDYTQIENYERAAADTTQIWECHHRLETDAHFRGYELIALGLYDNQTPEMLIFLPQHDTDLYVRSHRQVHHIANERYKRNPEPYLRLQAEIRRRQEIINEAARLAHDVNTVINKLKQDTKPQPQSKYARQWDDSEALNDYIESIDRDNHSIDEWNETN